VSRLFRYEVAPVAVSMTRENGGYSGRTKLDIVRLRRKTLCIEASAKPLGVLLTVYIAVARSIEGRFEMAIATINPATGQVIKTFEPLSDAQIEVKLQKAAIRS